MPDSTRCKDCKIRGKPFHPAYSGTRHTEDWYDSEQKYRVLRGASWSNYGPDDLLSSYRNNCTPGFRISSIGFRCVSAGGSSP
jgi:formylglycine-generating enzyme required for sulfatase activity